MQDWSTLSSGGLHSNEEEVCYSIYFNRVTDTALIAMVSAKLDFLEFGEAF